MKYLNERSLPLYQYLNADLKQQWMRDSEYYCMNRETGAACVDRQIILLFLRGTADK